MTVVSPSGSADPVYTTNPGEDCINVPEFGCVEVNELGQCGEGAAADVILDSEGNVVDVVCFSPDAITITPEELVTGEIPQNANQAAVEFSGTVYEDDLFVDANGVVLYADDPDDAVIVGNLDIAGNNTVVRGLTIDGDVSVEFNNASFVFCRITGNVTITANNTLFSGCEIFGDVTITGNNTVLTGNLFGDDVEISGSNTRCKGNEEFDDDNEDGVVDEEEISGPIELDCPEPEDEL